MYTATAPAGRSKHNSSFGTGKQFFARNTVAKYVRLLEERGLIVTERTQIQMRNGIRKNGSLRYTIVPMYEVMEQRYQRQVSEAERRRGQRQLAAQTNEPPCSPLRAAV